MADGPVSPTSAAARKQTVTRFVGEVINRGNLIAAEKLCTPEAARFTREWVEPFRASFPDVRMVTVQLVAEDDVVVGHFTCSATHLGGWLGHPPTGRRFETVDEVYFFWFEGSLIKRFWGVEDGLTRLQQLGLSIS